MSIDLRVIPYLIRQHRDFFEQQDRALLGIAPQADINGDHQIGNISLGRDQSGNEVQINEAEYVLYRAQLFSMLSNPSTPQATKDQIVSLLRDPQECLGSFIQAKRAGRLGTIERDAQAWLQRAETATQEYFRNLSIPVGSYAELPRTFRDHIAPNYFRNLAKAASANTDHNDRITLQELVQVYEREAADRFRRIDSNQDQKINLDEFRAANQGAEDTNIQQAFNSLAGEDHLIDLNEFLRLPPLDGDPEQRADNIQNQAQIVLLAAEQELAQANARIQPQAANFHGIDRLSSRLMVYDLSSLGQLDTSVLRNNDTFRILSWMRDRNGNENLLTQDRVNELLNTHVINLKPLFENLSALISGLTSEQIPAEQRLPSNNTDLQTVIHFLQRFRTVSHHAILSEHDMKTHVLSENLNLGEVHSAIEHLVREMLSRRIPNFQQIPDATKNALVARQAMPILAALQPLLQMTGSDRTLNRAAFNNWHKRRQLIVILDLIKREHPQNQEVQRALESLQTEVRNNQITHDEALFSRLGPILTENRVAASLAQQITRQVRQKIQESNPEVNENPHPFAQVLWQQFEVTQNANPDHEVYSFVPESTRIEGNQFLARALIQYAYLNPQNIAQLVQQTERNELFYLIEHGIAQGIYDRARSHAGDGVPGIIHYLTYPAHWLGASTWRERVANHAREQHQKRLAAIADLRNTLEHSSYHNLREALEHLSEPEHKRILVEELHVPELENIYYISNSREQEVAYTRFATYSLRGQVNSENGILSALRNRFSPNNIRGMGDVVLGQWQFRNPNAGRTIYDRLTRYSEHFQVHQEAASALTDSRGNGGDLNPLHWNQEFSDEEASLDGVWDTMNQQILIAGVLAGVGIGLKSLFGLGGPAAQWITRIEFAHGWRQHPNRLAQGAYWLTRALSAPLRLPLQRELSAAEVEIVNANAIRLAQNTQWGGLFRWRQFHGFINGYRANLQAGRLALHRSSEEAAARLLRNSQLLMDEAEISFRQARELAREADQLAQSTNISSEQLQRIQNAMRDAANLSRQGHALRQLGVQQRNGLGMPSGESAAYRELETSIRAIRGNAENPLAESPLISKLNSAAERRTLTGDNIPQTIRDIQNQLSHLTETQLQMTQLTAHQREMLRRGALAGGLALWGLGELSANMSAARNAARMVNPALVQAQNPMMMGGRWQLYFLGWNKMHDVTLSDEYRNNLSLQDWAMEYGIDLSLVNPEELRGAYDLHRRDRGSRSVYRNVFLNPIREGNEILGLEREPIRSTNLQFPETGSGE